MFNRGWWVELDLFCLENKGRKRVNTKYEY